MTQIGEDEASRSDESWDKNDNWREVGKNLAGRGARGAGCQNTYTYRAYFFSTVVAKTVKHVFVYP